MKRLYSLIVALVVACSFMVYGTGNDTIKIPFKVDPIEGDHSFPRKPAAIMFSAWLDGNTVIIQWLFLDFNILSCKSGGI